MKQREAMNEGRVEAFRGSNRRRGEIEVGAMEITSIGRGGRQLVISSATTDIHREETHEEQGTKEDYNYDSH